MVICAFHSRVWRLFDRCTDGHFYAQFSNSSANSFPTIVHSVIFWLPCYPDPSFCSESRLSAQCGRRDLAWMNPQRPKRIEDDGHVDRLLQ